MNNLFAQGGIPVPTPRPYPANEMAPAQMPAPPMGQQPRQGLLGGLFKAPNISPEMRNVMMAAGMAMGNKGQGFGQNLMAMQQHTQEQGQKRAQASMTAEHLKRMKAPEYIIRAAEEGHGKLALDMWESIKPPEVKNPTSWEEWLRAQQNPEYAKHLQSNKGGTTVNVGNGPEMGKLSTDYTYQFGPDGKPKLDENGIPIAVAVPGSPAWREQQQTEQQRQFGQGKKATAGNVVVQDVDRALAKIEAGDDGIAGKFGINTTTGLTGDMLSRIPGTEAHNTSKLIDTVRANSGFDKLQSMREASPTGGALGAVSERELTLLNAAIGNLEQSQDDVQLKDNLKRVKNIYLDIIHGEGQGPEREKLTFEQNAQPNKTVRDMTDAELEAIVNGQ